MSGELPEGWEEQTLADTCHRPQYGWTTKAARSGEVKLLRTTDISSGQVDWNSVPYCEVAPDDIEKYRIKTNDILISRAGSVGKSFLVRKPEEEEAVFASYLIRFRPRIDPVYMHYFLQTGDYWKQIGSSKSGIAIPNVNARKLEKVRVPVAPAQEQPKIAAKVDELFSQIDEGEAELKRAQGLVKTYRASLLKAAVTGDLTRDWRAANRGQHETGADLLARILKARRAAWETAELDKMTAKGRPPKDDAWKQKYKEPKAPDTSALPGLPEGWVWARAEQVCDFITKGTTPKTTNMAAGLGEVPFVKVYNLTFTGDLDFTKDPTFVSQETHQGFLARSKVFPSDVLMNIVGPPLGKVSVVPDTFPEWNINQAIAVFRPLEGVLTGYLCATLRSDLVQYWAISRAKATAGQFNLTLEICRDLPLPIPPAAEQRKIVELADGASSRMDWIDAQISISQVGAGSLRSSILSSAFSGSLTVPTALA